MLVDVLVVVVASGASPKMRTTVVAGVGDPEGVVRDDGEAGRARQVALVAGPVVARVAAVPVPATVDTVLSTPLIMRIRLLPVSDT